MIRVTAPLLMQMEWQWGVAPSRTGKKCAEAKQAITILVAYSAMLFWPEICRLQVIHLWVHTGAWALLSTKEIHNPTIKSPPSHQNHNLTVHTGGTQILYPKKSLMARWYTVRWLGSRQDAIVFNMMWMENMTTEKGVKVNNWFSK